MALCDREPLVPVTVTVKVPVEEAVQESVDVPEPPVMLCEDSEQVSPVAGLTKFESATVAVNPFSGATVIVEVPGVPTTTGTLVGLAAMVKSGAGVTVKVTLAV